MLKKAKERSPMMKFTRIVPKDDLMIVGIGDASFKSDDKAVGGVLLFLTDTSMTKVTPIYWKSKTISRVCYSSKDAETINIAPMMDDTAIYAAKQIERKTLRLTVVDLKERLVDGYIFSHTPGFPPRPCGLT